MEEVKVLIPEGAKSILLLIDEVQEIEHWEKAVVSLIKRPEFDVVVSGSNASLLSGERICPLYQYRKSACKLCLTADVSGWVVSFRRESEVYRD